MRRLFRRLSLLALLALLPAAAQGSRLLVVDGVGDDLKRAR